MTGTASTRNIPTLGWLCSYTPVEIAMAAGYLPIRISGAEGLPRSQDPRIYHLLCPFVRSVFHRYASGEDPFPGRMVFVRCCDGMVRLHDVWKAYIGEDLDLLDLPKNDSPEAIAYFAETLRTWAATLGDNGLREVTPDGLRDAIREMNRARSVFQEISRNQSEHPGELPYSRIHGWTRSWLAHPTTQELEKIKEEWSASMEASRRHGDRPRVLLMSSLLDQPGLVEMIEKAGLQIVVEDECLGARHFDRLVPEDGDPFESIAARYLTRWPCARMKGHDRRLSRLESLIDENGVRGIVAVQLKFCDQSGFDLPIIKAGMEKRGVPLLIVENDYIQGSMGQLRVRIEAFAEMLEQAWVE